MKCSNCYIYKAQKSIQDEKIKKIEKSETELIKHIKKFCTNELKNLKGQQDSNSDSFDADDFLDETLDKYY